MQSTSERAAMGLTTNPPTTDDYKYKQAVALSSLAAQCKQAKLLATTDIWDVSPIRKSQVYCPNWYMVTRVQCLLSRGYAACA